MNTIEKIKKRIHTLEIAKKEHIREVQITRQEALELPDSIKSIEGVKLMVVDKLGDKTKKDCFAYQWGKCYALKKLYCKKETCKFYQ